MKTTLKLALLLTMALAMLNFAACSDDDDDNGTGPVVLDDWIGTWLSAGANVAPLVYNDPVNVDSVLVVFNENLTVDLDQHNHVTDAWIADTGTYTITESATGTIHAITLSYQSGLDQDGIIEVVGDTLRLEVVYSAYAGQHPTPAVGFGAELGALNIQTYLLQD